jgi:hypothetical protein
MKSRRWEEETVGLVNKILAIMTMIKRVLAALIYMQATQMPVPTRQLFSTSCCRLGIGLSRKTWPSGSSRAGKAQHYLSRTRPKRWIRRRKGYLIILPYN